MWLRYFEKGKIREVSEVTVAEIDRILGGGSFGTFIAIIESPTSYIRASVDGEPKTGRDEQRWTLEFFDSASRHFFRSSERITLERVRRAFESFLLGSDEWHHIIGWQKMRLEAEIRDQAGGCSALFTWWGIECARTMPLMELTLEFRDSIRATAIVENPEIADPFLRFLDEVAVLPDPWTGERRFLSSEENLRISCGHCRGGVIYLNVALDADREDPAWTVELRMAIERTAWPGIIRQFRDYFAAVEGQV